MKKLLLLLSLVFIPVLNAQTYYDYEKVEVEELPTASAETTNKVYVKGKSYYVTESEYIAGQQRSIQLNDNLVTGKIYFKGITKEQFDSLPEFKAATLLKYSPNDGRSLVQLYNNGGKAQIRINKNQLFLSFRSSDFPYDGFYLDISDDFYFNKSYGENLISYIDEENRDFLDTYFVYEFDGYTTYSWKEVNKKDVYPIIENTLYVPNKNLQCYILKDRNTLRGYFNKPTLNSNADYYDFYLDQHYNSIKGTELIETDINCLDNITYNYLYRNDIVEILIFFVIVAGFVIYLPIKILFRFFRRFN